MATALFINRNDIIKNTPLQGAIDADALLPFMVTAQIKYIKNLIGTVLYDYLSAEILSGDVDNLSIYYQDLIHDHIKPTLIWYACVEYIPFSSVQFKLVMGKSYWLVWEKRLEKMLLVPNGPTNWSSGVPEDYEYVAQVK